MASAKKTLLQTEVDSSVAKKFDAMAKRLGHTRASYLRFIVRQHIAAPQPTTDDIALRNLIAES